MPQNRSRNKSRKGGGKNRFRLRNTRHKGRQLPDEKLSDLLKPTEADIQKLLAAGAHIGRRRAHVNMKRYVWKRRADGSHIINLDKTWNKLQLAARILVTVKNPADVAVMSTRTYGQRGAIKFAHYTGATAMVGKWVPGTFCNPQNKAYSEPRLLIVDDPSTCFAALRETSYVGIPVISFSGVDNNSKFVDCAIPCNNRGKYSVGLMFWLLAREVLRMRDVVSRSTEWGESVDLFFYRDPDEIKKEQEAKLQKKEQAQQPAPDYSQPAAPAYGQQIQQADYSYEDTYGPNANFEAMDMSHMTQQWDEVPQGGLQDWGAGAQVQAHAQPPVAAQPVDAGFAPPQAQQQAEYAPYDAQAQYAAASTQPAAPVQPAAPAQGAPQQQYQQQYQQQPQDAQYGMDTMQQW